MEKLLNMKNLKNLHTFEQFIEDPSMNEANISFYKSVVQKAIKDALGRDVKQSDVKVGAKKQGGGYDLITLNGQILCSSDNYDVMLRHATNYIKEDPAKYGLKESEMNEVEKMTFDEVADKYTDNPYGIGASRVELQSFVGQTGNRTLIFRTEDDRQRDVVMKKLKDLGFPAKKITKSTADRSYKYRYEVNLFESEIFDINEAAKWPLTDKIDSSTFYNMWASLDVASANLSDYMDEANRGKDADALFSLKVAYDELTDLMKSKAIEKQLKAIEAELKEKKALK
jgi:hypothetical protein